MWGARAAPAGATQGLFIYALGECAGEETVRALLGARGQLLERLARMLWHAAAASATDGSLAFALSSRTRSGPAGVEPAYAANVEEGNKRVPRTPPAPPPRASQKPATVNAANMPPTSPKAVADYLAGVPVVFTMCPVCHQRVLKSNLAVHEAACARALRAATPRA